MFAHVWDGSDGKRVKMHDNTAYKNNIKVSFEDLMNWNEKTKLQIQWKCGNEGNIYYTAYAKQYSHIKK